MTRKGKALKRQMQQRLLKERFSILDCYVFDRVSYFLIKLLLFVLLFAHSIVHNYILFMVEMPTLLCYKLFALLAGRTRYNLFVNTLISMAKDSGYECSITAFTCSQKRSHRNVWMKYLIIVINLIYLVDYFAVKSGVHYYILIVCSLSTGCISTTFNNLFLRLGVPTPL